MVSTVVKKLFWHHVCLKNLGVEQIVPFSAKYVSQHIGCMLHSSGVIYHKTN